MSETQNQKLQDVIPIPWLRFTKRVGELVAQKLNDEPNGSTTAKNSNPNEKPKSEN